MFKSQFYVDLSAGNTVSKLKRGENCNPQLYLGQIKLVCEHLDLLRFFPTCKISQSLVNADLIYFWDRPWYSDKSV